MPKLPGDGQGPAFNQPDSQPEVVGVVKSITGNEIVVLELDMSKYGGGQASSTPAGNENGNAPAAGGLNGARTGGGGMPAMGGGMVGPGGGMGPGGGSNTDSAAAEERLKMLKEASIGEATVTIPVGIQMLKRGTSGGASGGKNRPGMEEASLSDIVADKMVRIWLNPDVTDKKVAKFVVIN